MVWARSRLSRHEGSRWASDNEAQGNGENQNADAQEQQGANGRGQVHDGPRPATA
ncbi:hypothetical protein Neosp_007417 [[Neocosmospora] mangrovei]